MQSVQNLSEWEGSASCLPYMVASLPVQQVKIKRVLMPHFLRQSALSLAHIVSRTRGPEALCDVHEREAPVCKMDCTRCLDGHMQFGHAASLCMHWAGNHLMSLLLSGSLGCSHKVLCSDTFLIWCCDSGATRTSWLEFGQ